MPRYIVDEHGNVVFLDKPKAAKKLVRDAPPSPKTLVLCPICDVKIHKGRLPRHLLSVHGKPMFKLSPAEQALAPRPKHAGDRTRIVGPAPNHQKTHPMYQSDAMDATKFVGQFAREQGRFGSMPSHDAYDDESDA